MRVHDFRDCETHCFRLRLECVDGVEFDAAEQQHTVDARVDEMTKVLAPIVVVTVPSAFVMVMEGQTRLRIKR